MKAGERKYSPKRFAAGAAVCPACHAMLDREAKWCDACGFTGAKSMEMFGEDTPPLPPVLDVADLWDAKGRRAIEAAIKSFERRFPQIGWRVCAVALDPEVSLPLFGFWLMNASPLMPGETAEDREWAILLLIDASTGRASITAGYQAEVWLSDEMWEASLATMRGPLRRGRADKAVTEFLESAAINFESAYRRVSKQLSSK